MKTALQRILDERGMSPTDLADAIGVTRGYVSLLARGLRDPSHETIMKMAAALHVAPGDLLDAPAVEPQGFGENVQPLLSRRLDPAGIAAMMARRPRSPALYIARQGMPAFGYLQDDVLVADLNAAPQAGDVVLVNRADEHGGASTHVMRWAPPWLIPHEGNAPPQRADDNAPVLAVVVGMARGLRA